MVCACATMFFLSCWARPVKIHRPDLRLHRSQPRLVVTILPDLPEGLYKFIATRPVSAGAHPSFYLHCLSLRRPEGKCRGNVLRTTPQAEESSASLSEEGSSYIQRLRIAAAAKQLQPRSTTVLYPHTWHGSHVVIISNRKRKIKRRASC
jgi:hypothetical protein